jgi:hypothetical protein
MFTHYAQIENGVVVAYPVDPHKMVDGEMMPTGTWLGGEFEGKTYAYCHDEQPATDHTQDLVETAPAFDSVRGYWYRQYTIVSASAAVMEARKAKQTAIVQDCVADIINSVQDALAGNLTDADKALWVEFRNQTLAVLSAPTFPWNIVWPTPPENTAVNWNGGTVDIGVTRV